MKSDELIADYCFDVTDNKTKAVYPKADVDAAIDEMKDELNRAKAREDVLVTDNRDLLDKVKMLEERLRENAEHFKRNEAQILENADKVIAELEEKLKNSRNARKYWRKEYLIEYNECLHNKHKRCLAMAEKCDYKATIYRMMINVESSKIDSCPYFIKLYSNKKDRFEKWRKRWLSIAEKFKPNKEAK